MDINKDIDKANERLKQGKIGVRIEKQGERLRLRATLPPKPNDPNPNPYQQRLNLGTLANPQGLKFLESKAKEIGGLLAQNKFDWTPYLARPQEKTLFLLTGEWLEAFEQDYFEKHKRSPEVLSTWHDNYDQVFRRLNKNQRLTEKSLRELILSIEPDTRQRRRFTLACAALADFAELKDHDLRALIGKYSSRQLNPRDIPSDTAIAQIYHQIHSPNWRWVYGAMAVYGLRNHEVFYVDASDFPVLSILKGKTGERFVYPIYPEWAERWHLDTIKLPDCTGKNNSDLGSRVTKAFKRLGIPFAPYNLRHAWAIRSLEYGLSPSLAAPQMGHSIKTHLETYHRWISQGIHQKAFEALMNREDRPQPP